MREKNKEKGEIMRRKITKLEENLINLGFKLDHKTYCGRKSEKVDQFVYRKSYSGADYFVYLDRERTKIESYGFTNPFIKEYNSISIDTIMSINIDFTNELEQIYNFNENTIKEYIPIHDIDEIENPFDEEIITND